MSIRRMRFFSGLASLLLLTGGDPHAQVDTSPTLTISVEDIRNSKGVVGVLVFKSPRGWPENVDAAIHSKAVPANPEATTLVLDGLPTGSYAVVALHDENRNKKLDRNFFGVPKEGWGMSNNPKAHLSAPSFDRARFVLRGDTHLRIHLHY